jgi:acetyl esterase/lipase
MRLSVNRFGKPRGLAFGLAASLLAAGCGSARAPADMAPPAPETFRLWPAAAPGTESWTGKEVELDADLPGAGRVHIVTNVTVPTLTLFRPDPRKATGTAMLVVPGGAFRALAWDLEGTEVASWLARRGITAFVLKYRVRPPGDSAPARAESFDDFLSRTGPARQLALADVRQALRHIRAHASRLGVDADRVGMIGFSAGAMTVMAAATAPEAAGRPDFAAIVYGAMPADQVPPAGAPPLFVVAAQDDPQVPPKRSVEIFESWSRAHLPAELHLYAQGGHGFGMRKRKLPVDAWPSALEAWLQSRGLARPAGGTATSHANR